MMGLALLEQSGSDRPFSTVFDTRLNQADLQNLAQKLETRIMIRTLYRWRWAWTWKGRRWESKNLPATEKPRLAVP
jgi:hypothetical protein